MKRALKLTTWAVAGLIALLVVAVIAVALLVDVDGIVQSQIAEHKPTIEQQLGRKVEIGQVHTRVFPVLGFSAEALSVAADPAHPEQDRPLVSVGEVRVAFALWDAIVSGGKKLVIDEIAIRGLQVDVVRHKDGTLSYEDILARQSEETPAEEDAPMSEEDQARLAQLTIDELRIEDATFRFVDLSTPTGEPAVSEIKRFNLRVDDAGLERPVKVALDAAVFSETTNLRMTTTVGPIPRSLELHGLPPIGGFTLKADAVDLSKLSPYLPDSELARIDSALLSADWTVGALNDDSPLPVKGFVEVKSMQLRGGEKFDLRLDTDLVADLVGLGVDIKTLALKIGQVELTASGALEALATKPRFRDFKLQSKSLSPAALLAYYPAAKESLPEGLRLDGVAVLDAIASGDADRQRLDAKLDLSGLDILYPDTLVKKQGVPMGVTVKGDFSASDANLEKLALRLDELDLVIDGTVKNFDAPVMDLRASAKPFSFDRLVRLLPDIRSQLEAQGGKASGQGKLAGHVKGTMTNLDAGLDFSLLGMKLNVPGTEIDGDLVLAAEVKGNPDQQLSAKLRFDANEAVIRVKELMDKGVKTPLLLTVDVQRTPQRVDIRDFDLRLAELGLAVKGGVDVPNNQMDVKIDLQKLDLEKFAKTVKALPADKVKNSYVAFRAAVSGDPNKMETLKVAISDLDLRLGRSDLRGTATLKNPTRPDLTLTATSGLLDLDELMGEEDEAESEEVEADDPSLREYRFNGSLTAARVIYEGAELRDFKGRMRLEDGRLYLDEATFKAYEGTVSASGTEAEIWRGKMPFKAKLEVKDVNLGRALTEQTRYKGVLDGRADMKLSLSGTGYSTADLEKFLSGTIDLGLKQGRFNRASLTSSVAGQLSALEKLPGASTKALTGTNDLKDLMAKLVVKDGRLQLVDPVTFSIDGAKATLGGAVGIAGKLFLEGTYFLPGTAIAKMTGGKCGGDGKEVPIPLQIAGSVDGPEYRPNAGGIAASLVEACLKSGALDAARSKLQEKTGIDVPVNVDDAKKRAQEEVERQRRELEAKARAEAEAKARAEADRLKLEAEKRAAEQRKKAEDAAKKKAQDAFKKLGL